MSERLLTWPQLAEIVPFNRVHVARLEKAGEFPLRFQIGANRVAWKESEVLAWIESRQRGPIQEARGKTKPSS